MAKAADANFANWREWQKWFKLELQFVNIPPHSPTPVPVLTVSGAAGAKENPLQPAGILRTSLASAAGFETFTIRAIQPNS
jgi:hypothetical protein